MRREARIKIAIITPFCTGNIGTVLQAYATQSLINSLGYDNKIMNYSLKTIENPFLLCNLKRRGIVRYLAGIAGYLTRLPRKRNLDNFIKRLILTEKVKYEELSFLQKDFDYFLVGSDIVWGIKEIGFEKAYFLDWVTDDRRKGNFASGMAEDNIPDEYKNEFCQYLKGFKRLSVREEQSRLLIEQVCHRHATLVLDPTLVLDSIFWGRLAAESKMKLPSKYIFVAEYSISRKIWRDAQVLAEKYGYKIVTAFPPKGRLKLVKTYWTAGPIDFLKIVQNAEFILTDSYHMTIFSINFNRQFFSYITDIVLPSVSRFDSILGLLGLTDRVIQENYQYNSDMDFDKVQEIDYCEINRKLLEQRIISKGYLERLLNEANQELIHIKKSEKETDCTNNVRETESKFGGGGQIEKDIHMCLIFGEGG